MKRRPRITHNTRAALVRSRSGAQWSAREDQQLRDEHAQGLTVEQMAIAHERTLVGIESRLIRLQLMGVVETAARTNKRIAKEWRDSDGYWILLASGFHCDDAHAIHEPTKRAAHARMRDVVTCTCPDCVPVQS